MTYSTSHLGIATLLFYFFSPKSIKQYLSEHPKLFLLISLGSLTPDLDILTNGHRIYGHSIFLPLFLIALSSTVGNYFEIKNLTKNIRLYGFMWLTHIFYDMTFDPIALFYPFDNRFYDIAIGIVIDMNGFLFFSVFISGFFVKVRLIDQETGTNNFFLNWTEEQRISTFGEFLQFPIRDFFIHFTIFILYCYIVIWPVLVRYFNNSVFFNRIKAFKQRKMFSSKKLSWNILFTPFILLLITTSFLITGPLQGQEWVDEQEKTNYLWILSNDIQIIGNLDIKVPDNANMDIEIQVPDIGLAVSSFIIPTTNDDFNRIRENVSSLLENFENKQINYDEMINQYQILITSEAIGNEYIRILGDNSSKSWNFSSDQDLKLLIGLYDWNVTLSFVLEFNSKISWAISRVNSYKINLTMFVLFLSITFIVFGRNYKRDAV